MKLDYTQTKPNKKIDMNLNLLKKGSHDWLVIVVFIIIGSLIGYGISFFKTPLYEATALVTTNMHLNPAGPVNEFMLDAQINHIGDLYFNKTVVQKLLETENENGLNISFDELKNIASVERRMLSSLIKVRHADPVIASQIASDWAEILYKTLQDAYPYAVKVSIAKNKLLLLEKCASAKPSENNDWKQVCEWINEDDIEQSISEAEDIIINNSDRTFGLSDYLNISQWQPAEIPTKPISYHRGSMVFAGGVIGFILAMVFFVLRNKKHD
ncbi:MAG TPA: hypothetical protein GXX60_06135 [Anaerolineaceae bacterium]|nr:hypothetical protein [Anaerolineaceae bacterium]